jgi:DNA-binding LacI/PurR family transcriptional regulator
VKSGNMIKYIGIAEMLEERVSRGDYAIRRLPSETELARETSVSRMTARKALKYLIDKQVLVRRRYGRLEIANDSKRGRSIHQIAFLMPPVISEDVQAWQWAAEESAGRMGGVLRPVIYTDWNDVLISDVLNGFDGVFLMAMGKDVPPDAIEILKNSSCPVVSLDLDLSACGIPSIWLFPKQAIWKMLDHVKGLGHTRIACLHTCKMNVVFQRRIDYWREWKLAHHAEGDLFNAPSDASGIDYGAVRAKEEFGRLLDEHVFRDTAVLCTNVWTALGVRKAMDQRGLRVGQAISVCAVNDEMLAPWLRPSLTALRMADMERMLTKCVKWMMSGGRGWKGPKLLEPHNVPLHIGESTGPAVPAPAAARASTHL